jgi:hypothetical protein
MRVLAVLFGCLVYVACAVCGSTFVQADEAQARVSALLTSRFASGGRYLLGPEPAGRAPQYCREIESGDALLAEPVVSPYQPVLGLTSAKLLECDYPAQSAGRGWVVVLAATAENLAGRIVSSCRAVVAEPRFNACVCRLIGGDGCGVALKDTASWGLNNLQYPIAGFVAEGRENCKTQGKSGLIGFRHGVTIQYGASATDRRKMDYCWTSPTAVATQRKIALVHSLHKVYFRGRVAGVDSREVPRENWPPPLSVPSTPDMGPNDWQAVVMRNEIDAVRTGVDRLMTIRAAQVMGRPLPRF